jgi:lipopolysaccharide cholinephosphotransferase
MNNTTLENIQKRILRMAIKTRDILESENIPYFISYGTLLGAVRHKGFIPWDDDFDFVLFSDSYDKALKALRMNLPNDMFLEYFDSEPKYFHEWAHVKDLNSERDCTTFPQDGAYAHHGISIDLYKTTLVPENEEALFKAKANLAYIERRLKHDLISFDDYNNRKSNILNIIKEEEDKVKNGYGSRELMYCFIKSYNDKMKKEELFPLKRYEFEGELFYGPNNYDILLKRCYGDYMSLPPEEKRVPKNSNIHLF